MPCPTNIQAQEKVRRKATGGSSTVKLSFDTGSVANHEGRLKPNSDVNHAAFLTTSSLACAAVQLRPTGTATSR
jgi:hypothetical protein